MTNVFWTHLPFKTLETATTTATPQTTQQTPPKNPQQHKTLHKKQTTPNKLFLTENIGDWFWVHLS